MANDLGIRPYRPDSSVRPRVRRSPRIRTHLVVESHVVSFDPSEVPPPDAGPEGSALWGFSLRQTALALGRARRFARALGATTYLEFVRSVAGGFQGVASGDGEAFSMCPLVTESVCRVGDKDDRIPEIRVILVTALLSWVPRNREVFLTEQVHHDLARAYYELAVLPFLERRLLGAFRLRRAAPPAEDAVWSIRTLNAIFRDLKRKLPLEPYQQDLEGRLRSSEEPESAKDTVLRRLIDEATSCLGAGR